jgi:hypothetical protein
MEAEVTKQWFTIGEYCWTGEASECSKDLAGQPC